MDLTAAYPWIKALHVVSMVAWMAGLFYLPRLFVYHAERGRDGSELSETLKVMERRLMRAIMTPALVATWAFGLALAATPGVIDWSMGWPWGKAAAVLAMTGFHLLLGRHLRAFATGSNRHSGRYFRLVNEVPTLLLLVIVVLVVVRPF